VILPGVEAISSLDLRFAPHTSLTAVADNDHVYCFYTSSRTHHIRRTIIDGRSAEQAIDIDPPPTAKSAITAVMPRDDKIVLFFQSLNDAAGIIELYGITFTKPATAAAVTGPWGRSAPVKLHG
jgi:hypothetical protein